MLLACVTGFTLTSGLCGMATSPEWLIFFRVLQGLTGGGLQLSPKQFCSKRSRPSSMERMAASGLGIILAPILGPSLPGWISDNYSWPGSSTSTRLSRHLHPDDECIRARPAFILASTAPAASTSGASDYSPSV